MSDSDTEADMVDRKRKQPDPVDADDAQRLVPAGFDLGAAVNARSSTPREDRLRCPECQCSGLSRRSVGVQGHSERSERYWCGVCRALVDEPLAPGDDEYPEALPDGGAPLAGLLIFSRATEMIFDDER